MDAGIYVGLSAQLALDRRLSTIANNVANAGTAGYRAAGVSFSTVMSRTVPFRTAFSSDGKDVVDTRSGGLNKTDNPFDVAIQGVGLMAISTPAGTAYTRDGRMQMLPTGDVVSLAGYPILDAGGSPLVVDARSGPVTIGRDGSVSQGGRPVGSIGLFDADISQHAKRYDNAAFIPAREPEPITDFTRNGFVQGFVEESNVNAIEEMARLIEVTRSFEAVASGMERRDTMLRDAIQILGNKA